MKIELKELSGAYVAERTDMIKGFPGKKAMIENMKKAIVIAKPRIRRKAVESITVNKKESTGQTFYKFLRLMDTTRNSHSGHSFKILKDGKFAINMHYYYPIYDYSFYIMSLEWLPELAKKNRLLHNLLVECLRLMHVNKGINMLSDFGFYDIDEYLQEGLNCSDEEFSEHYNKKIDHYIKYFNKYNTLLNPNSIDVDHKKASKLLKNFRAIHPAEEMAKEWCAQAIDLAHTPGTMNEFVTKSVEQYKETEGLTDDDDFGEDGYPLFPDQWMGFGWIDDPDYFESIGQWMGETAGNHGVIEYDCMYDCTTQTQFRKSGADFKHNNHWPIAFTELLEKGVDLISQLKEYMKGSLLSLISYEDESTGIGANICSIPDHEDLSREE